jgi:Zn-dependent M28 family amino/carboxypeptidase
MYPGGGGKTKMVMNFRSLLACIMVILLLAGGLIASGDQELLKTKKPVFKVLPADLVEQATALREQALKESKAYDHLASLTTEVGPRFTGSANDRRAVEWAQRKLKELGFSNVRAEEVEVPCWQRGEAAGEVTLPTRQKFKPLALGGSVATPPGGIEAEVVEVTGLEMLARMKRSPVAGKIVFINQRMRRTKDGRGYSEASPMRRHGAARAAEFGAAAVLIRSVSTSSEDHAHTGMTHYEPGVPKIPAASLSNPEADQLEALIRKSKKVLFKLELGCQYLPDKKSANVIGEIRGRELPYEVVLLAAHLDSWDVGTGALDDGAGCAIIMEAGRLIGELEEAPRRTIRVFLAANEEFGLSGGLAYSERYVREMNDHVLGLESDFGADRVLVMGSRVAEKTLPAIRELAMLLEPLGIEYVGNNCLGGADLLPMMRYQLPLLEMRHDATRYFDSYHSAGDTLDKVDPDNLAQCVAAYAVAALVAAEIEEGFGRPPKFRGRFPLPFDSILEGKKMYR